MKTVRQRKTSGSQEISSTELQEEKVFVRHPQRGTFNFLVRFTAWCVVNLACWPIIRLVLKWLRLVDFVFVVYPGTTSDITSYIPLWMHWKIRKILPLSVLGISTKGRRGLRGLTITLMYEPEELSKEKLRLMLKRMERLMRSVGAHSIALAGRLPGFILAQGLPLDPPFLRGDRGGVFTIVETLRAVLELEKLTPKHTIGILGVGFLGGKVLRHLQSLGFSSIIGIDPRAREVEYKHVLLTNDPSLLQRCDVVLVLTGKGSNIAGSIPYLREGAVVIDDTHPQLPSSLVAEIRKKGGRVYKAALGLDGVHFCPEIPGYHGKWLPGCVIETLVANGNTNSGSQQEFDARGEKVGFRPLFIRSKGGG